MRLYHGSNVRIKEIDLLKSRPFLKFTFQHFFGSDEAIQYLTVL